MALDFAADMPAFFSDFADAGTLAGRPVRGIFDDGAGTPEIGGMRLQQLEPTFTMPADDTQAGDDTATLVIPQGTYTVRRIEPGDPGLVSLLLKAAA